MVKLMHWLLDGLGSTKFTIVYAVIFTSLVNSIASLINGILEKPPYTMNTLMVNIVCFFALGAFIARQIIKKNASISKNN